MIGTKKLDSACLLLQLKERHQAHVMLVADQGAFRDVTSLQCVLLQAVPQADPVP